ncbi:hypothetical protein FKM82_023296 [Ascaphus truei]
MALKSRVRHSYERPFSHSPSSTTAERGMRDKNVSGGSSVKLEKGKSKAMCQYKIGP